MRTLLSPANACSPHVLRQSVSLVEQALGASMHAADKCVVNTPLDGDPTSAQLLRWAALKHFQQQEASVATSVAGASASAVSVAATQVPADGSPTFHILDSTISCGVIELFRSVGSGQADLDKLWQSGFTCKSITPQDQWFGPGIYATPCAAYAAEYATKKALGQSTPTGTMCCIALLLASPGHTYPILREMDHARPDQWTDTPRQGQYYCPSKRRIINPTDLEPTFDSHLAVVDRVTHFRDGKTVRGRCLPIQQQLGTARLQPQRANADFTPVGPQPESDTMIAEEMAFKQESQTLPKAIIWFRAP